MLQSYLVNINNISDSFGLFQIFTEFGTEFGTEMLVFGTGQHLTGCLSAQDLKGVLVKRGTQLCENNCFCCSLFISSILVGFRMFRSLSNLHILHFESMNFALF